MAAPTATPIPIGPDTLITVKVIYEGQNRRFKLALRDLGAQTLPQKLRAFLSVPPNTEVKFDRYSDSAGTYVTLDSTNPSVYKQLYRAAKAKLKLRLKATIIRPTKTEPADLLEDKAFEPAKMNLSENKPEPRSTYLETVLSQPVPSNQSAPVFKSSAQGNGIIRMPGAFYSGDSYVDPPPRPAPQCSDLSQPTLPCFHDFSGTYSIDCNMCHKSIPNEHYHCSICDKGDYDLCQKCLESGVRCNGDDHWMIKRFIRNGVIIPSVTETCAPRKPKQEDQGEKVATPTSLEVEERTCNSCISQLPESSFVTCKNCMDFDLCLACFMSNEHGHALSHTFEPTNPTSLLQLGLSAQVKALCQQARGLIHQATCDGCNKQIVGVRNKCLSCPDFDLCSHCHREASSTHPGHRFASLHEALEYAHTHKEHHRGIYCDGPLCIGGLNRSYIRGDRYKCAVCHDTDFCANCEALPNNSHNKTHPLIKIKVPLRNVSISTVHESHDGQELAQLGDRRAAKNAATETNRTTSTNAATQVQTVAEVRPADQPVSESTTPKPMEKGMGLPALQAWYESDSTPDGSDFGPERFVEQSWTLRNPGPSAWPAGCAVFYIGGDDMRNLDAYHPSSVSAMTLANRSNVLEEALEPGKTAVFTVLLKSPARVGRAISYWRLKTPEGMPFGHKLWVDINVKDTSVELPIRPIPAFELPIRSVPSLQPKPASVSEEVEAKQEDNSQASSIMIFPKLEKESPVSSTHNIAEAPVEVARPIEATPKVEEHDLLDDVESLALETESDDEGFLTDEEYDVLDASDEDFLEAQSMVGSK